MTHISVNFNESVGRIKPMHAVNNGPAFGLKGATQGWGNQSNLEEFRAAGIPYARTHDSSFYPRYGLEHTVDVHAIFPDFSADPTDPASYDFTCTDHYMKMIEEANTKVFYRLGSRIEHEIKKYGTLPPADFKKWAVVCEHIIRHYNGDFADGLHMNIEYWEIWNEPDLDPDDSTNKRTWGGTKAEFFEFYHIAATHLKACFPHLKIGGPAIAGNIEWAEDFLKQLKAPLDFFSWHIYAFDVEKMVKKVHAVRELLDRYGYSKTESILNEWNYVRGWHGEDIIYSHLVKRGIKGAAFTLAAICDCQKAPLDMLMYYDARPANAWNGMFEFNQLGKCTLKGYFPFYIFNALYCLGNEVKTISDDGDSHVCAAAGNNEAAVALCYYNDDDTPDPRRIAIDLTGFGCDGGTEMEIYVLDENHDLELADRVTFFGNRFIWESNVQKHTCYLLKLKKRA